MDNQPSMNFYQVVLKNIDEYLNYINLTSRDVIRYITFFGIGFIVGSVLKKYETWIISVLLAIILFLTILQYFDFIIINKNNVKVVLHLEEVHSFNDFVYMVQAKIYEYWIEVIVFVIASIIGFKLG